MADYVLSYTGANINSFLGTTSQSAASGGTAISFVTTGEKYTWNNKLDANQGSANAGKFLIVGNDGNITLSTITIADEVSY